MAHTDLRLTRITTWELSRRVTDNKYHIYDINQFEQKNRSGSPILANPRKSVEQTVSRTTTSNNIIPENEANVNKNSANIVEGEGNSPNVVLQKDGESGTIDTDDSAIWRYKSSESYKINEALRSGKELSAEQAEFVEQLDRELERVPKYRGKVYRIYNF